MTRYLIIYSIAIISLITITHYGYSSTDLTTNLNIRADSKSDALCLAESWTSIEAKISECGSNKNYRSTVSLSLFDIGRGNWNYYQRSYSVYVERFRNALQVLGAQPDMGVVVFVDEEAAQVAEDIRNGLADPQKVCLIRMAFEETPYNKCLHAKIEATIPVMSETLKLKYDGTMVNSPEFFSAKYNEATNFKLQVLSHVAKVNLHGSTKVGYIDGGFHVFELSNDRPINFATCGSKMCIGIMNPNLLRDQATSFLDDHYKIATVGNDIYNGATMSGTVAAASAYSPVQEKIILEWLEAQFSNDDQAVVISASLAHPELYEHLNYSDEVRSRSELDDWGATAELIMYGGGE